MKAVLSLLLGVAASTKVWQQEVTPNWTEVDHAGAFEDWMTEFGKEYASLEAEAAAFLVWRENWRMINDFNIADAEPFKMRLNQFGDLTGDAFKLYVHGHTGSCMKKRSVAQRVAMREVTPILENGEAAPSSVDWTNVDGKSYVTPVKNQGQCGSCWAFSTTGSIEARTAIKNGQTDGAITSLSEQQLVDCSGSYGNEGCNGGLMDNAFKYVEASGGLCSESEYAYTGRDGTCKSSSCGTMYDAISSYSDVTSDSATSLEAAVAAGPVSIAIEADQSAFQFYSSGVLTGLCGDRLDHGVLAVGYGTSGSDQYWKVKNSWGESWGMDGYILICKDCDKNGSKGECGILMEPSFPVAK
jgi:C1A family cysteine protease